MSNRIQSGTPSVYVPQTSSVDEKSELKNQAEIPKEEQTVPDHSASLKQQGREMAAFGELEGKLRFREFNQILYSQTTPNTTGTPAPSNTTAPAKTPVDEFREAVLAGDTFTLELLVQRGLDINARVRGWPPITHAADKGDMKLLEFLIKNNADLNIKDIGNNAPLHHAALSGRPEVAKRLLEAGADPEIRNDFNFTPIMEAARKGNPAVIEVLARGGANVNATDGDGDTALHLAVGNGTAVSELIYYGADITKANKKGFTPLMAVVREGNRDDTIAMTGALRRMDKPARAALINAHDDKGKTALHYAVEKGTRFEVKELIRLGAKLNIQDNDKKTPLIKAVERGDVETIRALVNAGAKINIEFAPGQTALTMARNNLKTSLSSKQFAEIVQILENPPRKP